MLLPPGWKIRRELLAAFDQLKALGLTLISPLRKLLYNKRELRDIKTYHGDRLVGQDLVVYLVHQPGGLLESNYSAINSFVSQGSEVLVVSNGELQASDLERLKSITWCVIVRENTGYDFGGYRCGLNYLKSIGLTFNSVHLINDSIWFPVLADSDILHQLRNLVTDFGGPVSLLDSKLKGASIVLSYWLTIKIDLLNSDCFWSYWRKYIPSENKTLTVKKGERGLSRQMYKEGRRTVGLFTLDKFMCAIENANFDQLNLTLRYAAFVDPLFEEECHELLMTAADTEGWRVSCVAFIGRVAVKRNFLHSFCYPVISMLGVPFLKKNNLKLQVEMRKKYIAAVRNGDLPMPEHHIFKEITDSIDPANQTLAFR